MKKQLTNRIFKITLLLIYINIGISGKAQINRTEAIGAYVYNFANLSSHDNKEQCKTYKIFVLTDNNDLIEEFRRMGKKARISGRKIEITFNPNKAVSLKDACMIFIGEDKNDSYNKIYQSTQNSSTLLVSVNQLDKKTILFNIYDADDGKLLFEINKGNLYQRNIKVSDEVLMLGGSEVDLVELYLKSQQKLNSSDSLLEVTKSDLSEVNSNLLSTESELIKTEIEIENLNNEILDHKEEKSDLIKEIKDYDQQIKKQKDEYEESQARIASINDSLELSQKRLHNYFIELQDYKNDILNANKDLEDLDNKIAEKEMILVEQHSIIDKQRTLVIIFIIGITIIFSMLLLLLSVYRAKHRQNKTLERQKVEIIRKNNELAKSNKEVEQKNEELHTTLEEVKRIQKQLVQSEKMASLGVLSAGIAHEINNPINFVYAGINSLLRDFEDIEPVITAVSNIDPDSSNIKDQIIEIQKLKEENYFDDAFEAVPHIIKDIKIGADRTAQIVKGLKSFSRMDKDIFEHLDIHQGIDTALLLLKNKYKNHIEIFKEYDSTIPEIVCFPGKINQALMNIISNAIEAIDEKGNIWINTSTSNNMLKISIKDNGCGISQDNLKKMYDPFFTTKEVGKGTGLGLSITYGIIEDHKGSIEVNSEIKVGTEFIIYLPLTQ